MQSTIQKSEALKKDAKKCCERTMLAVALLMFSVGFIPQQAQASIIEAQAVRALIGEASGEGLKGMQAVAEVVRRRGSLRGIYGYTALHVDNQPKWVWDMAQKAWERSRTSNLTNHADHFESTDFPTPYWAKGKTPVAVIGKHEFYRLKGG